MIKPVFEELPGGLSAYGCQGLTDACLAGAESRELAVAEFGLRETRHHLLDNWS